MPKWVRALEGHCVSSKNPLKVRDRDDRVAWRSRREKCLPDEEFIDFLSRQIIKIPVDCDHTLALALTVNQLPSLFLPCQTNIDSRSVISHYIYPWNSWELKLLQR